MLRVESFARECGAGGYEGRHGEWGCIKETTRRWGVMRAQVAWRTMVVEEEKEVAYVTCNEGE